jgi:enamine deaminase RidA (YjgF/YER057c/UK114 family)
MTSDGPVHSDNAPSAVGAYPHAHRVGNLIFVSGIGPRQAGSNEIPGGPIRDAAGNPTDYDIRAQTRAVIENITSPATMRSTPSTSRTSSAQGQQSPSARSRPP